MLFTEHWGKRQSRNQRHSQKAFVRKSTVWKIIAGFIKSLFGFTWGNCQMYYTPHFIKLLKFLIWVYVSRDSPVLFVSAQIDHFALSKKGLDIFHKAWAKVCVPLDWEFCSNSRLSWDQFTSRWHLFEIRHASSVSSLKSSEKTFLFSKTFSSVPLPWGARVSQSVCLCARVCVYVCVCVREWVWVHMFAVCVF